MRGRKGRKSLAKIDRNGRLATQRTRCAGVVCPARSELFVDLEFGPKLRGLRSFRIAVPVPRHPSLTPIRPRIWTGL